MDAPRAVPAISSSEAEEFFTNGTQAYPAESSQPCCDMLDVPGVGMLHAHDCPAVDRQHTLKPEIVPDGCYLPLALYNVLRDELLVQLLFASRNLVQGMARRMAFSTSWYCEECSRTMPTKLGPHGSTCKAGRLLRVLEELQEIEGKKLRKETAPDEGTGRAGNGKSTRASLGEPWRYRVDKVLHVTSIYDCDGNLIASLPQIGPEAEAWAKFTVETTNSKAVRA